MKQPVSIAGAATLVVAGALLTCTSIPEPVDDAAESPLPERSAPPVVTPDPPSTSTTPLPDYGREHRDFAWLPQEDRHLSRSIGTVTDGFLVNGRRVAMPHPVLEFLDRQYERGLHYTSDPMLRLLSEAGHHVAEAYPNRPLHLGNLSRRGGGDIPHSVSHNNGRDADIGFFVVDDDGEPVRPPDLLPLDGDGVFDGASYDADDGHLEPREVEGLRLHFDSAANWRLVEGLIESDHARIQYIFISNPLRQMLLEEAQRQDASSSTRRIAAEILVQPGGQTPPHDDHFHIRIHCSAADVAAGCQRRGRPGPTFDAHSEARDGVIDELGELLITAEPTLRTTALRRLAHYDDHPFQDHVIDLLDDDEPRVRAAAVRLLGDDDRAERALVERLEVEPNSRVFVELTDALAASGDTATEALVDALSRDKHLELTTADAPRTTTSLVADALARHQKPEAIPALIDALQTSPDRPRPQIAHALRILTNQRLVSDATLHRTEAADDIAEQWTQWWEEYGDSDRDQWLIDGFRDAGLEVSTLDSSDVWELCRAIDMERHLSVNAQRRLEDISDHSVGSLQWDSYDASFYWRRWFERRKDRFGLASIPAELSTADGYSHPDDDPS